MTEPVGSELAEALGELRLFLSDQLAPLMVADSLQLLALQPPELAAREIHGWLSDQYQGPHASVPMSDYLFHALKKIHVVGEMRLVPTETLDAYFESLAALLLELCPEDDREMLRGNIARIGLSGASASAPLSTLYRQAGSETPLAAARTAGAAAPQAIGEVSEALRRFHLLLASLGSTGSGTPSKPAQLAPELITAAASGSRDAQELDRLLKTLRGAGIDVTGKQLFRALSKKLPDWVAPPSPPSRSPADDPADASGGITGAIRRVISLAPDKAEALTRFRELVETAVEAANEGSLSRAVTMVELAQKILDREKLDAAAAASFRDRVHAGLDLERLRAWAEKPEKRATLKRLLVFFPRLRPRGLMDALRAEKKRDMRRLWLELLEAHGHAAREEVLHELESLALAGDSDWYYQRNLLYAARRIPRSDQRFVEAEAGLFERLSDPSLPPAVVKEAVANLGQLRNERAEAVLVGRLKAFETRLARPETIGRERDDLAQVLDRIAAALGRFGTPAASRAIVDRALRATPGASPAWLAHLAGQDLSGAPDVVEALLKALRAALPVKLFGLSRKAASPHVPHLIAALASTPSPVVRSALEDVAQRFSDREVGHLAAKALEAPAAAAPQTSSLTGDLELFGLPSLLQTFDQNEATGVLVLRNVRGDVVGSVSLEKGRLRRAFAGSLSGAEAVYQLLQRPVAGSFSFTQKPQLTPEDGPLQEPASIVPLVLEGMRRYDELERAAALVPDDVPLRPTRVKPTPHGAERDPIVLRSVWDRAASGATAVECEKAARADAYRVRRMLVHWVEEGSLEPETALAS